MALKIWLLVRVYRQNLKISCVSRTTNQHIGRCAPQLRAIIRSLRVCPAERGTEGRRSREALGVMLMAACNR